MKKLVVLGLMLLCSTMLFGSTQPTKASEQEDLQYNLLDQLVITRIQMDTWLDLSQLDNLLQKAKDIVNTFENMKTTAGTHTMEYKTLVANRNEARKIMNTIYSIHRRRSLPKTTTTVQK